MGKVKYLEGMRGLAALIVLNEHLLRFFFAAMLIDSSLRGSELGLLEELSFPPFNLLHNGASAVSFFFVLSGFVLSYKFFSQIPLEKPRGSLLGGVAKTLGRMVKRYIRICIPVLMSLAAIYIFLRADIVYFTDVVSLTGSSEVDFFREPMPLINVFKQGLVSTIFMDDLRYNPALWTISTEIFGSFFTILLLALFGSFRTFNNALAYRIFVYAVGLFLIFPMGLSGFLLGIIVCDFVHNLRIRALLKRHATVWVPVAFVVGLFLLSYSIKGLHTGIYKHITLNEFNPRNEYLYNMWGAALVLLSVLFTPALQKLFSNKLLLWVGNLSFSLYLTHYLIIISVTFGIYLNLPIDDHLIRSSLSVALSLPVIFIFAFLFDKYIDKPSIQISNLCYRALAKFRGSSIETPAPVAATN